MATNGIVNESAVLGLVALGLAAALVVVLWRLSRSNELLSRALSDVSLAKPWTLFQRGEEGEVRSLKGESVSEATILAQTRLENARARKAMVNAAQREPPQADEMEVDERTA